MTGRERWSRDRDTPEGPSSGADRARAMPSPTRGALAVAALAMAAPASTPLTAQDIEASSAMRGVPLPTAYYDQIAANPDFYEFERALFRRSGAAFGPRRSDADRFGPPLAGPARVGPTLVEPVHGEAARAPTSGEVRLPVVLALFADSPEVPHVSREMVQASLFSGPAARGTIREAYLEMSRGALDVQGDTWGWVRTGLTMSEVVGTDLGFGPDERIGEYLIQALDSIDGEVDFSQYDNDGPDGLPDSGDDDGYVDVITFEYLEVAASCGGPAIWPHRTTIENRTGAPYVTDDPATNGGTILIQDYITQSATDCSGSAVQDASVITHEFGHALGLPDWYHWVDRDIGPFGRRWVLGCWALMAAGSWGCGPVEELRDPFGPTHMIGFSKEYLGWVEPQEVGEVWNDTFVLDAMEVDGRPLLIPLDDAAEEFLYAEFRRPIGFDAPLPGAGVLFYKRDDNASIRPEPESSDPYFLSMLEQDGDRTLVRMAVEGGNRGEIGDAWGVDGVSGKLNGATRPELALSSGTRSSVMVHEVYVDGDQARVVLSTGRTPRLITPEAPFEVMKIRTFEVPIRIAGGVGPYIGSGDLPEGFTTTADGDELLLVGSVRDEGPYAFDVSVRDANGRSAGPVSVDLTAPLEWTVDRSDLMRGFLRESGSSLSPGELRYLDEIGNGNGFYDVGDLRRWLREEGS